MSKPSIEKIITENTSTAITPQDHSMNVNFRPIWNNFFWNISEEECEKLNTAIDILHAEQSIFSEKNELSICQYIDWLIAKIDEKLSKQVDDILHHPKFQSLESSWRSLEYLLNKIENNDYVQIKILNINHDELLEDLRYANDFSQSHLFRLIDENEYGSFGGTPFSAIILSHPIENTPDDLFLLENLTRICACAHAPLLATPSPHFFGLQHYTDLNQIINVQELLSGPQHQKWQQFRQSEEARYLAMILPRTIGREPYNPHHQATQNFIYHENISAPHGQSLLWLAANVAYSGNLIKAFNQFGWLAATRGVEGGGLIQELPVFTFHNEIGETLVHCPTDIALSDRLEKQLSDLGFIGLVYCKNSNYAVFFSGQSAQDTPRYNNHQINANARLGAQLPYIFAISRIAHYLKAIVRDKIGSFNCADQVQNFLNQWLAQYVLLDDSASQQAKARFPLRQAHVEVSDSPGRPGQYKAAVFLRPHFQLDELNVSLQLVTELPAASR